MNITFSLVEELRQELSTRLSKEVKATSAAIQLVLHEVRLRLQNSSATSTAYVDRIQSVEESFETDCQRIQRFFVVVALSVSLLDVSILALAAQWGDRQCSVVWLYLALAAVIAPVTLWSLTLSSWYGVARFRLSRIRKEVRQGKQFVETIDDNVDPTQPDAVPEGRVPESIRVEKRGRQRAKEERPSKR